jgi:hypothetical protein
VRQVVRQDLIAKCTQWPKFLSRVTDGPGNNTRWFSIDNPPSHFLHTWHGWWVNWSSDRPSSVRAVWPAVPKDAFSMSGYGKDNQRHLFAPGPDYTRYNVEAFRAIDAFIDTLRRADILASPYFYYDPRREVMWKMAPAQDRAYIRYGMSRIGAFGNVMPVLGNEIELKTTAYKDRAFDLKSHAWANEMGTLLKSLSVFDQPVSVHNPSWHEFAVNPSYFTLLKDWPFASWTDFVLKQVQVGSIGTASAMSDAAAQPKTPTYNERAYARRNQLLVDLRRFGQPLIDEEPGYDMGGTASAWIRRPPRRCGGLSGLRQRPERTRCGAARRPTRRAIRSRRCARAPRRRTCACSTTR